MSGPTSMRTRSDPCATFSGLAQRRWLLYRSFSVLLTYPARGGHAGLDWRTVAKAARELGGPARLARSILLLRDRTRAGGRARDLEREYVDVFGHSVAKECPPYETLWGPSHVFMQTQELADIAGFYRAWGVDVSDGAKERADHLSVELEFMSLLSAKEARAAERGLAGPLELCREAQAKFMDEHLGRWAPSFASLLEKTASPRGFYAALGPALGGFVLWDSARMGVAARSPMAPRAAGAGPPEECAGCGVEAARPCPDEATNPGGPT